MLKNAYVKNGAKILAEGRFIRVLRKNGWEYVQRSNCKCVVIILAMTKDHKVLMTEQYRLPVNKKVIEFPAGLVSDQNSNETIQKAAKRELLEETGYLAKRIIKITEGPVSGGLTSDMVTIVKALDITKVASGGGDETEKITVYEVSFNTIELWLKKMYKKGFLVDPKIYAGLYFLRKYNIKNYKYNG